MPGLGSAESNTCVFDSRAIHPWIAPMHRGFAAHGVRLTSPSG